MDPAAALEPAGYAQIPPLALAAPSVPAPPVEGDKPKARFEMDGILHNFARNKRIQIERLHRKQSPDSHPQLPLLEETLSEDRLAEPIAFKVQATSPTILPRKGILKTPKVRFPDELPDKEDVKRPLKTGSSDYHREHYIILDPPQPPPSPPPPPPVQPIDLFLPTIEKDKYLSETAYKLYTKFIDELAEFVDIQRSVIAARLNIQEKRQELKRLREEVSRKDIALIDYLRQHMSKEMIENAELSKLYEDSQRARDIVGPSEADYEPLEVLLGADENRLQEKYGMIEARFEAFFKLNANTTTQQSDYSIEYSSSSAPSAAGDREWTGPESREELLHGVHIGEQVGVGQLPVEAGGSEVAAQSARGVWELRRPNCSSGAEAEPSVRQPSITSAEARTQLEDTTPLFGINDLELQEQQLQDSRENMTSQDLEGIGSNTLFETSERPEWVSDDMPMTHSLQRAETLLLLENDKSTLSILSDYLASFESITDRVNRWLLHQLRLSRCEVYHLQSRILLEGMPENHEWLRPVLTHWSNDNPGNEEENRVGGASDGSICTADLVG